MTDRNRHKPAIAAANDPIGTKNSGYSTDGPFRCDRCHHYRNGYIDYGYCDHPKVVTDLGHGHAPRHVTEVAASACCTYFHP